MRLSISCSIAGLLLVFSMGTPLHAQIDKTDFEYTVTPDRPFGAYNPVAPPEVNDFEPMIGSSRCRSVRRRPDGTWPDSTDMVWEFRYIFDGQAVQDMTWKADGTHSSSIRQFNADSSKWVVTYYSVQTAPFAPSVWTGGRDGDAIVLIRSQRAPNGMEGESRLTFYNIRETGFKWIGEWVSKDGSIVYPFWKISCVKRE